MKLEKGVFAIGIIISIFGIIFHLQGQAIVGPESSFMYANPSWVTYGVQILVIGTTIIVGTIVVKIFRNRIRNRQA